MTDKEIYNKIEETYNSDKGKGFITHLLRSFLPIHRSSKMLKNTKNLKLVDCITGEKLSDANAMFDLFRTKDFTNAIIDDIKESAKAMVGGNDKYERPESVKKLKSQVLPVAITCDNSDKVMSEQTLAQLYNFFATQILMGNKHINWIANNERGKMFIESGKKSGHIKNKKEERVVKKASERAKMSLGDMDVLKELKKRMEK